ncbi:MAG: GxxExxY protein [Candidatus Thermoplasmatota archaeon]
MHAMPDANLQSLLDAMAEVHSILGPNHGSEVYKAALGIELDLRQIPYQREAPLPVWYRGERLGTNQPVSFLCFDGVLLEPKARALTLTDETNLMNVVRGTRSRVALLASFAGDALHVRRVRSQGLVSSVDTLTSPLEPQPSSGDDPVPPL